MGGIRDPCLEAVGGGGWKGAHTWKQDKPERGGWGGRGTPGAGCRLRGPAGASAGFLGWEGKDRVCSHPALVASGGVEGLEVSQEAVMMGFT